MPALWLGIAAGLGWLWSMRLQAGARDSAILDNSPLGYPIAVNVVYDGKNWRPEGSEGLLAVRTWASARLAASLGLVAKIRGRKYGWDNALGAFF